MSCDTTTAMSVVDRPHSSLAATEAADKAVAADSTCNTGFDLINHAIRMGSGSGTVSGTSSIAPPMTDDESSKAVHHLSTDYLLQAHLLDQQQRGVTAISASGAASGTPISRVSSASSTLGTLGIVGKHSHASELASPYANPLLQQLDRGGIIAALQRRHNQPLELSLPEIPVSAAGLQLHQHMASYLGGAAAMAVAERSRVRGSTSIPTKTNKFDQPSSTSSALKDSRQQHQLQDEQNARQLNPNAFQFPWKLHDMLDRSSNEGYDNVVSWVDNGESFRVHLPEVFVETVMPRFFKQTKYKSFQRQLNLYGFTRLHNGLNKGGYKHRYFRQGQRTMCQLITRCPIRDSSSIASTLVAAAAKEDAMMDRLSMSTSENGIRMIVNEDSQFKNRTIGSTSSPATNTLPHNASSVSIPSKVSSCSLKQQQHQQQSSDAVLLSQYHMAQQAAAIMAARQQALTLSSQMIDNSRQEQQLQHLYLQKFETHRLQQLQQQQQREPPLSSSYVPGMPLAGTDHSAFPSIASQKLSISHSSSLSPVPESTTGSFPADSPDRVLDSSNYTSLQSESREASTVTPTLTNLSDKENQSIFPKEFQFPWKLYLMLERADVDGFSSLVSWMPGDSSFKVHDTDTFVESVMPRFFKQTKYKSFQRQLNLYGFIRVDHGPCKGGYSHPRFRKGRKDLLVMINRIKIKGNGRPRSDRGNITATIVDTDSSVNSNKSKGTVIRSAYVAAPLSIVSNPKNNPGIAVILKAIKAKEGKETGVVEAPASSDDRNKCSSNVVHHVADSSSDGSNSTIPSTIDVEMKEYSDAKNGNGLSWKQHPSESFSDWTIEVIEEGNTKAQGECAIYHVHRRVLAVGPKKSVHFVNIFKSSSANMTKLRLSKQEAKVFPLALDFIYGDTDFDLDAEKAYALYSLGERLGNASIVQTVTKFYSKVCMTKNNVVEFLKLGQTFLDKSLLEAAVLKCSQEIWSIDVESASKIDPGLLLRILVIATTVAQNGDAAEYDSLKLSQMVAISASHASTATLTLEIFRSLTSTLILPSFEPIAAIELLATENTLLSAGGGSEKAPSLVGDHSFHERCVSSIYKHWEEVRNRLSESTELANAMRSIPSMVLFDLLMKTTASEGGTGSIAPDMTL